MLQRIIALVLIAGCSLKSQTVSDAPAGPEGAGSSVIAPIIAPKPPVRREGGINPVDRGVDWAGVFREASRFLAVEHAFRCATEYDTRNAKGQFIGGYANSLTNLHGWADGDPFYVNYVGHPIQGAVAGYIWAQNDRRYRAVEFGKDPMYWKARFRSAAFAWAYSAQFEIGPVSEASIGYVQAYFPQQGFVDHVITPSIGLAWMIGEDSVDRYIIEPVYDNYNALYIKGYRIYNTVAITLRDVSKTSKVIAVALKAGANQVVNVDLYTSELRKYRDQARDLAMKAAKEKAQALASAAVAASSAVGSAHEKTELTETRGRMALVVDDHLTLLACGDAERAGERRAREMIDAGAGQVAANALGIFLTFNYVTLGWLFFDLSTPAIAWRAMLKLFGLA